MRTDLRECKVQASLLLKGLLSPDPARALQAAERLRVLPEFHRLSAAELLARRDQVQRKHALAVIAKEHGHASWADLKHVRFDPEVFFARPHSGFLNRWFASYAEARASLEREGGFLFPFRDQFFVCEAGFLRRRGVDVDDPDWKRIGFDWVEAADSEARARLEHKLLSLGLGS